MNVLIEISLAISRYSCTAVSAIHTAIYSCSHTAILASYINSTYSCRILRLLARSSSCTSQGNRLAVVLFKNARGARCFSICRRSTVMGWGNHMVLKQMSASADVEHPCCRPFHDLVQVLDWWRVQVLNPHSTVCFHIIRNLETMHD